MTRTMIALLSVYARNLIRNYMSVSARNLIPRILSCLCLQGTEYLIPRQRVRCNTGVTTDREKPEKSMITTGSLSVVQLLTL